LSFVNGVASRRRRILEEGSPGMAGSRVKSLISLGFDIERGNTDMEWNPSLEYL